MKNTVRRIIAMAIALVMVFGSVPAFATEIGDTVLWDEGYADSRFYDEYRYGGKLTEGENHLTSFLIEEGSYYYYYEFDAEKSGYYLISNEARYGEFGDDGILYNACFPMEWGVETNGGYYDIVYLEKGTAIIGVSFTDYEFVYENADIEIRYLDDEITDIIFDETIVENLIINENITFHGNSFEISDTDYTVVFSNGEKIEADCETLVFTMKSEPVNGVNTVYATFAGYEKAIESTMYYVDYFVESVELSNVDYYLDAYEFYNGRYSFIDYNGEEITVNYTDGTSETFVYGHYEDKGQKRYITLMGKECFVGIWHSELNLSLEVNIADQSFGEYECKPVKANKYSNDSYFSDNINEEFERFINNMDYYWDRMWNSDNIETFYYSLRSFINTFSRLLDIAEEIKMYIRFILV